MPKVLVGVSPRPNERYSIGFPGQNRPAHGLHCLGGPNGREDYDYTDFLFYEADTSDVPALTDFLSSNFPGREINVYELTQVAVRPVGELVVKKITEKGILPS